MKALKEKRIRDVSAGWTHIGACTASGELWTWGCNMGGCAAQPMWLQRVDEPTIVEALYIEPTNLALGKAAAQSSVYDGLGPGKAVNGDRCGDGVKHIIHTQFDSQAWWEVDLGKMAVIEEIKVGEDA